MREPGGGDREAGGVGEALRLALGGKVDRLGRYRGSSASELRGLSRWAAGEGDRPEAPGMAPHPPTGHVWTGSPAWQRRW